MAKKTNPFERECQKCGHSWTKRTVDEPKQCPVCKTYKWNRKEK